jgi:murein tripeptide amidase MpaA
MDRAYINENEGKAVCCWNSPTQNEIEDLFKKAHVNYESITEVEEMQAGCF